MNLTSLDLRAMSGREAQAYSELLNEIRAERVPADPQLDAEGAAKLWAGVPDFVEIRAWALWCEEQLLGVGAALLSRYGQNEHQVVGDLMVSKAARCGGIGTALLAQVVSCGLQEGRRVIQLTSRVSAGHRFAASAGARVGMHSVTNQLDIQQADRAALLALAARLPDQTGRFTLRTLHGPCPDELLDRVAAVWHLLSDAPSDDLDIEDELLTATQLRELDTRREASGIDQITVVIVDRQREELGGFAHLCYDRNAGSVIKQDGIAVAPELRGMGLARWMEASGLLTAVQAWPQALTIRTDQAKSNTRTIAVFHSFGFKQVQEFIEWEADLEALAGGRATAPT